MGTIRKTTFLNFLISIAIYILLTGFFLYSEQQTNYDRLSNQLYYDNILLVYNGKNIDWNDIEKSEQYRVYVEVNSNCRILIKDTSKWTPPMLKGYYPKEVIGEVAVIGKNVEQLTCLDTKGNSWLRCIGREFRVTGVVGADYATSCDDLVILFGTHLKESDLDNVVYIVDVKTQRGAQKMEKLLNSKYPEIQIQHGSIKGTARLTKSSYFYKLLIVETLFITILSVFIMGKFRQKNYDMRYKVYQIYGLPISSILINGELEIFAINIISLFIISSVGYFVRLFAGSQLKIVVCISIGIIVISSVLELIFFWQKTKRIDIYNKKHRKCSIIIHDERG